MLPLFRPERIVYYTYHSYFDLKPPSLLNDFQIGGFPHTSAYYYDFTASMTALTTYSSIWVPGTQTLMNFFDSSFASISIYWKPLCFKVSFNSSIVDAPDTQLEYKVSKSCLISYGSSVVTTTSEIANRPPGLSTR